MLNLTRRVGETLNIGEEITVTVLGVKGNQVRIGVNAPKDVAVHREEIHDRLIRSGGQPHSFASSTDNSGEACRPVADNLPPQAPVVSYKKRR